LMVGRESFDQPTVHIALHFEDAVPAAIFDEHAGKQDDGDKSAAKCQQGDDVAPNTVKRRGWILGAVNIWPDCLLKRFIGLTVFMLQMREEVELRVARDFWMSREKGGEL